MKDESSHISLEDEDGNSIGPADPSTGNCFSSMTLPRKGDKIQIDDRNGEWEVVDVIHTLTTGLGNHPVTLRLREISSRLSDE